MWFADKLKGKFSRKPKLPEIILFWNYLRHFLAAGLPLVLAFHRFNKVLTKNPWPEIFKRIEFALLSGKKLSHSLAEEKNIFSNDVLAMINIAEQRGNYPEVIAIITENLKWQLQTKQSIRNALRYPVILIIMMGIMFYLVLEYIVPQLQNYLTSMGKSELPFATQLLLKVSQSLPLFLAIMAAGGIFIFLSYKLNGRIFYDDTSIYGKASFAFTAYRSLI